MPQLPDLPVGLEYAALGLFLLTVLVGVPTARGAAQTVIGRQATGGSGPARQPTRTGG